jgi:hypothetical protein
MRVPASITFLMLTGCAGTLYSHYAGPAQGTADEAYACVQAQLKELGYVRSQYNTSTRWILAQKSRQEPSSSGLYRQTLEVLDTKVDVSKDGVVSLEIKARTYDQYATVKSDDAQERKASDRVQIDARTLGQACTK